MDTSFLVQGLILGFSIAAPVGPIGVLCIRRTLAVGPVAGLLSGLGAATADAFYGAVAGFGLTFISTLLLTQQYWLAWVGGLYLLWLGAQMWRAAPPSTSASPATGGGLAGAFLSTFFLTLTNPVTILSFAAIFAGMGLAATAGDFTAAGALVLGVFAGSALWWFTLTTAVSLLKTKLRPDALRWVNRVSGAVICGFGLFILAGLL
ncbi:MAG: LysE family transporter [Anaerolineae bacterium]